MSKKTTKTTKTTRLRLIIASTCVVGLVIVGGCASIVGLEDSTPSASSKKDSGANIKADATVNDTSSGGGGGGASDANNLPQDAEAPVFTFECSATEQCTAGEEACCGVTGSASKCFAIEAGGCPVPEAGAPDSGGGTTGGSLECKSYTNCFNFHECCWNKMSGSSKCEPTLGSQCKSNEESLCFLQSDGCGQNRECQSFTGSPDPKVGHCVDEQNHGGSSGFPGFH